jgi:hypothetical protein
MNEPQVFSNLDELIAAERARRAGSPPAELVPEPDADDAESPVVAGEDLTRGVTDAPVTTDDPARWPQTPEGRATMSANMKRQWAENRDEMLARVRGRRKAKARRAAASNGDAPNWSARIAKRRETMLARYGTTSPSLATRQRTKRPARGVNLTVWGRLSAAMTGQSPLTVRDISRRLAATGEAIPMNSLSARLSQLSKDGTVVKSVDQPARYSLSATPVVRHRQQVTRAERAIEQAVQATPPARRTAAARRQPTVSGADQRRSLYRQAVRTAFEHQELELVLAEIGAATLRASYE